MHSSPTCVRLSSALQLNRMTGTEAEAILATVWCTLEKHSLTLPRVEARLANGLLDIVLTFRSEEHCALVQEGLLQLSMLSAAE
jgi:hypothetical protein